MPATDTPPQAAKCANKEVSPTTEAAGTERYTLPPLPVRLPIRGFDFRQFRWGPYTQNISVASVRNTTSTTSATGKTLALVVSPDASFSISKEYDQFRRRTISNPVPSGVSAQGNITGKFREPHDGRVSLLASAPAPGSLTRHYEPGTGESVPGPFTCQEYPKAFTTKTYLDRHCNTAHLVEPLECNRHEKRFSESNKLNTHMLSAHSNELQFKCEECGKGFQRAGHLARHVRFVHLHDPQFECEVCGRACQTAHGLQRHVQGVHLKEQVFKYDSCRATY